MRTENMPQMEAYVSLELPDDLFDFDTMVSVAQDFPDDDLALEALRYSYYRIEQSGDLARLQAASEYLAKVGLKHVCQGHGETSSYTEMPLNDMAAISSEYAKSGRHTHADGKAHDEEDDDDESMDTPKSKKRRRK